MSAPDPDRDDSADLEPWTRADDEACSALADYWEEVARELRKRREREK